MSEEYDLVVIGAGPGGYNAAIRSAQYGAKTACIEKSGIGGTCVNVGCIPSKALLESSAKFEFLKNGHIENFGITVEGVNFDLKDVMYTKDKILSESSEGIKNMFRANGVEYIEGHAEFIDENTVRIFENGKEKRLKAKNFLIATGSRIAPLRGVEFDGEVIISSTEALSLRQVPQSMVVIGAGVIGLELGSVWSRFGTNVTIIELDNKIAHTMDEEMSSELQKLLVAQGLKFELSSSVKNIEKINSGALVTFEKSGTLQKLECEKVLVCVGRLPNTVGLGLENIGIEFVKGGFIKVDDNLCTNIKHIYAIGDVSTGPMLTHKARDDALYAVEIMRGKKIKIDYRAIPAVIYTHPEVASVGKTAQELRTEGVKFKIGKSSFMANGRAKTQRDTDGFVKILASDDKEMKVLGIHILHGTAGSMINECAALIECNCTIEDIEMIRHSYPDLNESIKAAARDILWRVRASEYKIS